jgi:hypothetical protein
MQKHNPRIMFRSAVLQLEEFSHEICEPDRYGSVDFSRNLRTPNPAAIERRILGYAPVEPREFLEMPQGHAPSADARTNNK